MSSYPSISTFAMRAQKNSLIATGLFPPNICFGCEMKKKTFLNYVLLSGRLVVSLDNFDNLDNTDHSV